MDVICFSTYDPPDGVKICLIIVFLNWSLADDGKGWAFNLKNTVEIRNAYGQFFVSFSCHKVHFNLLSLQLIVADALSLAFSDDPTENSGIGIYDYSLASNGSIDPIANYIDQLYWEEYS